MNNLESMFLDDFEGKQAVCNLVATRLLGIDQIGKIDMRYGDLKRNFSTPILDWQFSEGLEPYFGRGIHEVEKQRRQYSDTSSVPIPITHPRFQKLRHEYMDRYGYNNAVIGCDMPSWFNLGSTESRIMIVGQDPLRNPRWYWDCNDAVCSTPFGLHSLEWRNNGRGGKRLFLLIDKLTQNKVGVYMTDIIKFYVRAFRKNTLVADEALMQTYRDILLEEIDIVKPGAIIALGIRTQKALMSMALDSKVIAMPHFSGSAQGTFPKFFAKEIAELGWEGDKLDVAHQAVLFYSHIKSNL